MRFRFCSLAATLLATAVASAAPVLPDPNKDAIKDRANFFPNRKHLDVPGKIIAILVTDAQPILSTEGRSGPADQLCIGYNGGSYRWVYVPVSENPLITNLNIQLPNGKTRVYPSLTMASPKSVKQWEVNPRYALVEVEVNNGDGSPAGDAFVATKMTPLDGSKAYPIKVAEVIDQLKKDFDKYASENAKELDAAMDEAGKKVLKDRKPTGPKERSTLMFVTWIPETEKLHVRFRTTVTDGAYQYANGINIELPRPLPPNGPPQGGIAPPPRLPEGLRWGTQFGIEYGLAFEVDKTGRLDATKKLVPESFQRELQPPPAIGRPRPNPLPLPPRPILPMKE